jgi:hypothetical protein
MGRKDTCFAVAVGSEPGAPEEPIDPDDPDDPDDPGRWARFFARLRGAFGISEVDDQED